MPILKIRVGVSCVSFNNTTAFVHLRDHTMYLTPLRSPRNNCWFFCVPPVVGNELSNAVSTMSYLAGIGGYKTNHSLPATAAARLYSSGIDEQLAMKQTVHCSTEEVRSYKRMSSEQQKAVSDILSNCKKSCTDIEPFQEQVPSLEHSSFHLLRSVSICLPTFPHLLQTMLVPFTSFPVQTSALT